MSSVERFSDTVITCTWLLVISGTEPRFTVDMEYIPTPMRASVSSPTINLFFIENAMILFIISY
ncbi:hypothetical protein NC99_17330 [Sunxiuqinia dokdonensis]|uniref:Uncharacterized protein n=1 Tax=Sunxiuqinia dokdonensis TaxID=1409788 RepID=A0A0L8VAG7_9BACT|nr:hypothetical protein NC99_17330 [Sunxiuqinia dokdonensis]